MCKVRVRSVRHCEGCKQPIYIAQKDDGVIMAMHEGDNCIFFMCQTEGELRAQLGIEDLEFKPLPIEVLS